MTVIIRDDSNKCELITSLPKEITKLKYQSTNDWPDYGRSVNGSLTVTAAFRTLIVSKITIIENGVDTIIYEGQI